MKENTMELSEKNFSKVAELSDLLFNADSDEQKQDVIETIVDVLNESYDKADVEGKTVSGFLIEDGDKVNLQVTCVEELRFGNIAYPVTTSVTIENIPSEQLERVNNDAISAIQEDDGNIISRFQDDVDFNGKIDELKAFVSLDDDFVDKGVDIGTDKTETDSPDGKDSVFDEADIVDANNYVEPDSIEFDSEINNDNIETLNLDNDFVGGSDEFSDSADKFDKCDIEYAAVASEVQNDVETDNDNLSLDENDTDNIDEPEDNTDQSENDWWSENDFYDSVD